MDDLENLVNINNTPTPDELYKHMVYLTNLLSSYKIKFWISYGTLLGAIRQKNIIDYDYDFDLGILYEDYPKVLDLSEIVLKDGYILEKGMGTVYSSKNKKQSEYKWRVSIKLKYDNNPIADLYIYSSCPDGYLRRYDPIERIYYYPNSTFPYKFVEELEEAKIRDVILPCPRHAEILLEHIYGPMWKIPIRAHSQEGEGHSDYDYYGSYKYSELGFLTSFINREYKINLKPEFREFQYIFPPEQYIWSIENDIVN
jgi:hypothetical protein